MKKLIALLLFVCICNISSGQDQEPQSQTESANDLAQSLQNPLASMVAVPILNSFGFNATQNKEVAFGSMFQPIFPFKFQKFNIVNRVVWGFGYVPGIIEGLSGIPQGAPDEGRINGTWGITDMNYTAFLSPNDIGKVAWGIGPSVDIPIASDNRMGTGKWTIGPSAVLVYQTGPWTFDLVLRQVWSVGGSGNRIDVNQLTTQPLIAYGLGNGWVINTFPSIVANWDLDEVWTVPLGGGISKVLFLGQLPTAIALQYYQYAIRPDLAPTGELRLSMTLVFAK